MFIRTFPLTVNNISPQVINLYSVYLKVIQHTHSYWMVGWWEGGGGELSIIYIHYTFMLFQNAFGNRSISLDASLRCI